METMRVELVETKKEKKYLQGLISLVTAVVAVLGVVVSYMSFSLTAEEKAVQREDSRRNHFTSAIEHLKDESLAIRLGALYELRDLCFFSKEEAEKLTSILSPYVREHIENEEHLIPPVGDGGPWQIDDDVYLACMILSELFEEFDLTSELSYWLHADGLFMAGIQLHGSSLFWAQLKEANLSYSDLSNCSFFHANLQDVNLSNTTLYGAMLAGTNLQRAKLENTNLYGAYLIGADLRDVINLTATQLLEAIIDDTTLLDPDLRAEYERLKAEQPQDPFDDPDLVLNYNRRFAAWKRKRYNNPDLRAEYDRLKATQPTTPAP